MNRTRTLLLAVAALAAAVTLLPQGTVRPGGGGQPGGGSSAATCAHTTDVLKGDGAGNCADAGYAANASGIVSLWANCSGTLYLGADRQCHSAASATSSSQLNDYALVNTSATVLTMLSSCAADSMPCNLRQGSTVFTPPSAVTATLSGNISGDTVFIYLSSSLDLQLGYNGPETIVCSAGLNCITGVVAFPYGSIPLWQISVTSMGWPNINPLTMDKRAIYSNAPIQVSSGIGSAYNGSTGLLTLFTDPIVVPRYYADSGAPSQTCTSGRDFYTDITGLDLYFCDATNTWKKANGGGAPVTDSIMFPAAASTRGLNFAAPLWDAFGPGVSPAGLGGTAVNPGALIFDNSGTAEARFYYKLPHTWTGTVSVTFGTESLAGAGVTNTFTVSTVCVASGGEYIAPTYGMGQAVNFVSNASASAVVEGTISSLDMGTCAIDQLLIVDVVKTDTNASMNALYARLLVSHT